ncbi:flagellar protein FlgA [Cellulomonas chitinilytica]|uniref:Flagellar protein FlgA n=2 Tax=Cellulomonas chitinilytica TaxID=398759 RepID=A0A919P0Y8_9CELL|nr:flagellar protein FlgA [Cellulomonas chitinilytica]
MNTSVLDLPAPVAPRLRRPGWRDPRLLAGVAMVAASVVLGSWAVRTAQRTVPVYVARDAIVAGQRVEAGALAVVDVRLGSVDVGRYLSAEEPLPTDGTALRTVGAGELVPRAAIGDAADVDVRPVAIGLVRPPAKAVTVGALVDLWFTPSDSAGAGDEPVDDAAVDAADAEAADSARPHPLATGLTVAEVTRPDGGFAATGAATVQVLVPTDALPGVLAALSADGTVDVVPLPGSGG